MRKLKKKKNKDLRVKKKHKLEPEGLKVREGQWNNESKTCMNWCQETPGKKTKGDKKEQNMKQNHKMAQVQKEKQELDVSPKKSGQTTGWIRTLSKSRGIRTQAIQDSKQVNLPKANKVSEDNFLDPKNTRPINIYSCWYRLFASMLTQSDSMKQWCKETLPSSILGGPETKGADMVTSELHDLLHTEGFFATLDLSQAFDNIQADVATTSMRTLGIPPRLTGVLRHQWLHQRRWMTWII